MARTIPTKLIYLGRRKSPSPQQTPAFIDRLREAFESGRGSDITIICGTQRFQVHKLQLSVHSEFFDKMFNGEFMEAGKNEVELKEDDPAAVETMFRWMYTLSYEPTSTAPNQILHHLQVAATADKYGVQDLVSAATVRLDRVALLDENEDDFMEAIREVYEIENAQLAQFKQNILNLVNDTLDDYKEDKEEHAGFWNLMKDVHSFAVDVAAEEPMSEKNLKRRAEEEDGEDSSRKKKISRG